VVLSARTRLVARPFSSIDGGFRPFLTHFGAERAGFPGQKGRSPTRGRINYPHVIKIDIINAAAKAAGVDRQKAAQAVETIIDTLRQALTRGERIELRGFGVFLVKPRKRGIGRNPKRPTEEVQIPPGFTIRFRPGKELRNMTGPPEKPVMKAASSGPRASGTSS
jgi:DNA-binding protein HU-beta